MNVFLIVFDQQWSSVAQRSQIYQVNAFVASSKLDSSCFDDNIQGHGEHQDIKYWSETWSGFLSLGFKESADCVSFPEDNIKHFLNLTEHKVLIRGVGLKTKAGKSLWTWLHLSPRPTTNPSWKPPCSWTGCAWSLSPWCGYPSCTAWLPLRPPNTRPSVTSAKSVPSLDSGV